MKAHRDLLGLVATIHLVVGASPLAASSLVQRIMNQIGAPQSSFDELAFGGKAGARQFRVQLENLLRNKIGEIEQMFQLTAAQREKLRLAGHGDIKRLLDEIEDARREFDLARQNIDRLSAVRKLLQNFDVRVSSGPFEFGSLFQKTLLKMFDEKQLKRRTPGQKKTSVGA